jgi:DNA primase
MSVIDEIKARIDIIDLVSESVKLRRSGKSYSGFCPFHTNTRTPAFVVFPDSGTWRCFGQCNEGGDIFRFVMKKEGWDFPQALQYLAERAGVRLEPQTQERKTEDEHQERLRGLLEEAVNFYRHHLLQTDAGHRALEYLNKRGLTQTTIESFGLGYAPDTWESALQYFTGKGYKPEELLEVGMASERQSGSGVYDRFRNRIMFPIRDPMGHMAGFGARILNPEDMPKFLNSPQTALFDKGRLLYGLDAARKAIRTQDQVVIVEGYLDVIVLHQGGFTNTVSPMGTALTEDQLRMLKRFTRRIVLALDADAAGEKATLRGLELARQAMDRSDEIAFDARGLLRHEARLEADVRVTTIPAGMDPDEVVLRDPEEWRKILDGARPIVEHVMETLASGRNLDDPKVKNEIAARVLPLIEDVPGSVEREAYRQRLARMLRVDERALMGTVPAQASAGKRPARRNQGAGRGAPVQLQSKTAGLTQTLETYSLKLMLRKPEALHVVNRELQKAGLSRISAEDFEQVGNQLLARVIEQSLEQDEMEPRPYIQSHLDETLTALVNDLLEPMPKGDPEARAISEELFRTLVRMRLTRINQSIEQLRYLQEDFQQQGDLSLTPYQEMMNQYTLTMVRLQKALDRPTGQDL